MDFTANRLTMAANHLRSLKRLNRELSLSASVGVDVSSAPQQGTGSIVWLLPSLCSLNRFTHLYRVVERRERERPVIPSFSLLRM